MEDFSEYAEEFMERLKDVLSELFNPEIPFTQTCQNDNCKYCPYNMLCH
ncbi:MAG: PD-(D/E)XK nuclease family protein [Bacteroidaceae bacterium]|nr:PD-(D/E)XK nuclease family protein [Bacteroidaceae bacterium]